MGAALYRAGLEAEADLLSSKALLHAWVGALAPQQVLGAHKVGFELGGVEGGVYGLAGWKVWGTGDEWGSGSECKDGRKKQGAHEAGLVLWGGSWAGGGGDRQ